MGSLATLVNRAPFGVQFVGRLSFGPWRWVVFGLLLVWAAFAGKDVSWDVLNHQLYLPFSWITGRFRTDLFAASGQSYQNPLGYFPIYGLIRLGVNSWGICIVLAGLHAAVVWPLDRAARLFWPDEIAEHFWFRGLSLAACCVAPVFLVHVGTTSSDPISALMVVWAVVLCLESGFTETGPRRGRLGALVAGALLGLACAIKLSNLVFALALCLLWCGKRLIGQISWTTLFAFAAGLSGAFAICAGPWMWWLWHDFSNPVFPLFNNLFHSPYAPKQALTTLRFVPATPWAQFSRLWELAEYKSFIAFEGFLPDLRPVLLVLTSLIAAVVLTARGGWRRVTARASWFMPGVQLAVFLGLSYVLWLRSSGNARYALPLFLVAGVALVRAAEIAFKSRLAKVLLLTVLLLHLANYLLLGTHRFTGTNWDTAPYIEYRISPRLRDQPFLHLTIGTQTNSAVALFLAQDGAMANPIGELPMSLDGPLGARFQSLLTQWHGRTRVLFGVPGDLKPKKAAGLHAGLRALLYRIGVDVDWSDCERIVEHVNRDDPVADKDGVMLSCAISYRTDKDLIADGQLVQAERVFALMEKACPQDFSPTPFASEHNTGAWRRQYANTDGAITVSAADGVFFSHFRRVDPIHFGSIDDVLSGTRPLQCPQISFQTPE